MPALDLRAISASLFLPLLYWTGAVIATAWFGYPGVVCMTPLAWLLALPVGLRIPRESASPGNGPVIEAAVGGGLLGLWQALLFTAALVLFRDRLPDVELLALITLPLGILFTAALAGWIAWLRKNRS